VNGVALVLDKRLGKSLTIWTTVSSRILSARLLHKHGHLIIIVAYAPTKDHSTTSKDEFYASLESLICSVSPHDKLIVIGDFNAETGVTRVGFEQVIGNFGYENVNDISLRLLTMCSSTNLAVLGFWFKRKKIHRHS